MISSKSLCLSAALAGIHGATEALDGAAGSADRDPAVADDADAVDDAEVRDKTDVAEGAADADPDAKDNEGAEEVAID